MAKRQKEQSFAPSGGASGAKENRNDRFFAELPALSGAGIHSF